MNAESTVVERHGQREPLTQSLAYAASLQARGVGCLLAGAAVLLVQPGKDGLIARMQRPRQIDMAVIDGVVQRVQATQVLVEPAASGTLVDVQGHRHRWRFDPAKPQAFEEQMTGLGWRVSRRARTHTKTRVLDLRDGVDAALAGASSVARRNVRGSTRDGVEYSARPFAEVSAELLAQLRALHDQFHAARPHLRDDWAFRAELVRQFEASGDLVVAREEGRLVGAVYVPRHDGVAHYYAVLSSADARSSKVGTGMVFAALQAAVRHGCDLFDFVGVRDERLPDRHERW
ncbi:MAG: GNAT family N-acetyltransferase, partial [Myxococcota bacterium]